jgi:hypothetical protein
MAEQVQAKSSPPPTSPPVQPEIGWKGAQREGEVVRHRWQRDWTTHTSRSLQSREHWRRIRILTALGGSMLLFGLLMYYLLYFPVRVPMVTLVVTDYAWPLPPNAWAHEDRDALKKLDDPGRQTFQVSDGSSSWRTQQRGLLHLEEQLREFAPQANRAGLLVLYISMHGAVNDYGEPCLLTRESSPIDSATWLPLRVILERIRSADNLSMSVRKLVILDCNRQLTNWNSGQLYNGFAERLPQLLKDADVPNLVVLNSTGPGQQSATSADLGGSVFGHFLHLGLAGEADLAAEGGNRNGRVSLRELASYLESHVSHWTSHFYGASQQPMLVPADTEDFDVAWRLNHNSLRQLANTSRQSQAQPPVSSDERNSLWRRRDELWSAQPYRFDPLAWRNFEHQLLWLEQLARSGPGYEALAAKVFQEASRRCDQMEAELSQARMQPSLLKYVQAFAERPLELPRELPSHSLPLAGYLGRFDVNTLSQAKGEWNSLLAGPSVTAIQDVLQRLQSDDLRQPLSEAQYLTFLSRYDLATLWTGTPTIRRALQLRDHAQRMDAPPDQGALPGDERAHYWIRADLDIADQRRREAEDRLLSAASPDDALLEDLFSSNLYEQAKNELDTISQALAHRDEAWARVVYWAQWLARPQLRASDQDAANHLISHSLLPLLETLHDFDEAIVRRELDAIADEQHAQWSSASLARELDQRMNAMQEICQQEFLGLLEPSTRDARKIQNIDQWLALPLCSWDQRTTLLIERQAIMEGLRNSFDSVPASRRVPTSRQVPVRQAGDDTSESLSNPDSSFEEDLGVSHLSRMASAWPSHPVRLILNLSRDSSPPTGNVDLQGQQKTTADLLDKFRDLGTETRRRFRMLAQDEFIYGNLEHENSGEPSAVSPGTEVSGRDAELSLEACCRAESRLRSAASFWFPSPLDDPIHRLRRRDLQHLLVWNSRRILEDSWGSAGMATAPFFVTVARNYLQGAERLIPPSPSLKDQIDLISQRIKERQQLLSQAFIVTASDILYVDSATTTTTRTILRSGPTSRGDSPGIPVGDIVSFLRDEHGRFPETTRLLPTSVLDKGESEIAHWDFVLPGASLADRGPKIEAITTFRGNEYRAPLLLRLLGGRRVAVDLPPPGPSEITLQGAPRRRASIQFILDCSQSMAELENVEAPGPGPTNRRPRMDLARNALEALLQQLAAEQQHHVGVRFFGHRVGWSVVESGKLLRQNRYIGEIPEGLQPFEDVELVLPPGRFDEAALGTVMRSLRSVQPWGETPLYLSLIAALEDFSREDSEAERSIVVITDGLNYQFNPLREQAKVAADVLAAAEGKRTAIHIIGFGIPAQEQAEAQSEFSMIAEATGGSYLPATNASLLLRLLQDLLRPSEVHLLSDVGTLIDRADVGTTLRVQPTPPLPQRYFLSFESLMMPLDLRGGERVQLQVSADRSRLESLRMGSENLPQKRFTAPRSDVLGTEPIGVLAMAHRPVRDETGVRFTVSLQREDRSFLSRPAEVWGEIRPLLPSNSSPEVESEADYVFYDTVYAADQPNPVLHWFAEGWPTDAQQAEIRLWCRPIQDATPNDSVSLQEIADQVPQQGTGFMRPDVPHVSFQARTIVAGDRLLPLRVVVIERHPSGESDVGDWRIDLQPSPRKIERRLDPAQNVALHTFYFEGSDPRDLRGHELRFTSKSRFIEDAWYLPEPIVVNIADRSDLLQLSPAPLAPP